VCMFAPSLVALTHLCQVLRTGLTASATVVLWLGGQRRLPEFTSLTPITEEEVTTMVREGAERGIFEKVEQELIAGVFEFTDTAASEIMVPRVRMQALDVTIPTDEVVRRLMETGYSRVPVYEGDLDHIVGVLYLKDILRAIGEGQPWEMRRLLHPPLYVPEMVQISRLLRMLQQRRLHMAIVVDEHGGVAGLVTTEDILEQLVGDIRDEGEPEADALVTVLPDGAMVAQGSAPLWELRERYALPLDESVHYHTVAGLLLARLGHIPQGGEAIVEQGYTLTVVDMDGPRIARVKIERRSAEETGSPAEAGSSDNAAASVPDPQ
jgi:putative hemolysin